MHFSKKLHIKVLNLNDSLVRNKYSHLLMEYENIFTYPLGSRSFHIRHGFSGNYDYFSFFEQMGEVHYIVAEHDSCLVAAGCAILRNINNEKVWYLCDFKLTPEYRGKGILEKMFRKYVFSFYLKSQKMFFVNMSTIQGNGLIKKASKIFKIFGLKKENLYFFEWSKNDVIHTDIDLTQFVILTNAHKKDIVIDDKSYPIYHLVQKNSYIDLTKFQKIHINDISDTDTLMYCGVKNSIIDHLLVNQQPATIGSFVSHRFNTSFFSSAEI